MLKGMRSRALQLMLVTLVITGHSEVNAATKTYMLVQLDPVTSTAGERLAVAIQEHSMGLADADFMPEYAGSVAAVSKFLGKGRKIVPFFLSYPDSKTIDITKFSGKEIDAHSPGFRGACNGSFICAFELSEKDLQVLSRPGYSDSAIGTRKSVIGIRYGTESSVGPSWLSNLPKKHFIAENCEVNKRCVITTKILGKYAGEITLVQGDENSCIPSNSAYLWALLDVYQNAVNSSWSEDTVTYGGGRIPQVTYALPPIRPFSTKGCVPFSKIPVLLDYILADDRVDDLLIFSAVAFGIVSNHAQDSVKIKVKSRTNPPIPSTGKPNLRKDSQPPAVPPSENYELHLNWGNLVDDMKEIYDASSVTLTKTQRTGNLQLSNALDIMSGNAGKVPPSMGINLPTSLGACERSRQHLINLLNNVGDNKIPSCRKGGE